MSFEIALIPMANFKQVAISNTANGSRISLCTKGGLLNEWIVGNNISIINGNDFSKGWGNFEMNGFKSGKMSPFSCRLANGQYDYLGNRYTIEKFYLGAHALHGIQYDALYHIESTHITDEKAVVLFVYHYQGTDKGYPFPYTISLEWTYSTDNTLIVKTSITNQHHLPIPIMDGWHPYFSLGNKVNEYTVQFKNKGKIEYDQQLLPTGKINTDNTYDHGKMLGNTHLDDCWLIDETAPCCTIQKENEKIIIQPLSNYPYLQLYTPDDRMSIAIENLSAAPNCLNNKMGLHHVKPHESWELITSYQYVIN
jgi:aldose 1-epimerase